MNADASDSILKVLDGIFSDAANKYGFPEINSDYDYMCSRHYIDFEDGKNYTASLDHNPVNRLT